MANSKKNNAQKNDNKLTVILIIGFIVIAAFATLYFLNNSSNKEKTSGSSNLYGKTDLAQSTIDILDDKNYQNIILPEDLEKKISSGDEEMVYFFKSDCPYCKRITPILMPLAKDMGVHIDQYNLLEFEQGWDQYNIKGTPTLVYYKDGKEQARVVGEQKEDIFKQFFEATILKDR